MEILPQIAHHLHGNFAQTKVDRRILQQPPDQKLHRQVIHPLAILGPGAFGRGKPRLHNPVADRKGKRHPPVIAAGMRCILAQGIGQVAQDIGFQGGGAQIGQNASIHYQSGSDLAGQRGPTIAAKPSVAAPQRQGSTPKPQHKHPRHRPEFGKRRSGSRARKSHAASKALIS